jgi:hypothetical protein
MIDIASCQHEEYIPNTRGQSNSDMSLPNSVTASFNNACKVSSLPPRLLAHASFNPNSLHEVSLLFIILVPPHTLVINLYHHHMVVWPKIRLLLLCWR